MQREHPNYADMALAGWAATTTRLLGEVEDFLEGACKAIKKERLRRLADTRRDSAERAMRESRLSLQDDEMARMVAQTRARLAPHLIEAVHPVIVLAPVMTITGTSTRSRQRRGSPFPRWWKSPPPVIRIRPGH